MKRTVYYLMALAFVLTLGGCGNSQQKGADAEMTDTMATTESDSVTYYGIYKGRIPIPGTDRIIESTLSLNDDATFSLHAADVRGEFDEQGNYAVTDGLVTLFLTDHKPRYYRVEKGLLRILNDNKEPLSGDGVYTLKQVERFPD